MGILLREALRRLCVEIGWSYAVFWRAIGCRDQMHLVWEDGHCERTSGTELGLQAEDGVRALFYKIMVPQVHVLGDGIVGKAALTGNHEWVLGDNLINNRSVCKGLSEMNNQFLAGIQTLAVIPVLPHGVVQLGSTQMVMENTRFINYVKCLFEQLGCVPGALLCDITKKSLNQKIQTHATVAIPTSANQFGDVGTIIRSLSSLNGDSNNHQLFRYSDSRSDGTQPSSSSLSTCLYDKTPANAPEAPLTKQVMPPTNISQPVVHRVGKPILPLDNQLESPAQVMFSNLHDSSCGSQFQQPARLSSSSLTFAEEQFLSMSSIRPQESANNNNNEPTISSFGKSKLLNGANDLCRFTSLPSGIKESNSNHSAVSSGIEVPQVLNPTNHLISSQMLSRGSEPSIPTSIKSLLGTSQDGWLFSSNPAQKRIEGDANSEFEPTLNVQTSLDPVLSTTGNDLFDVLGLDYKALFSHGNLDDVIVHSNAANSRDLGADVSTCITQVDMGQVFGALNDDSCCNGMFLEAGRDQLLEAVVSQINSGAKPNIHDNISCKASLTETSSSYDWVASSEQRHGEFFGISPVVVKSETGGSNSGQSVCTTQRESYKSQIALCAEKGQSMTCNSISAAECKRADEVGKLNRKRPRPGENPRPRPKDRQMIQDRFKELREIVPNGAKCSIDALLEKTIKHMLFLQSVTKHADKLKETGEPKIISKDGGLLLKDNFEGGRTWAFEVGSQSMVCPIVVEDLNPPRQMLVEMLCEERGFFLEIADLIRGLGLTILKGVMQARNDKVWARFAVEANRDVTRMEIFLSLVRLLEPSAGSSLVAPEGVDNLKKLHNMFQSPASIPATGLSDHLW